MSKTMELARQLEKLHINNMYKSDFYWTWDKTDEELAAVFTVADALRDLRERNRSTRIFDSGTGHLHLPGQLHPHPVLLCLRLQPAGAPGPGPGREEEPDRPRRDRRETANMVSFMAEVIGIRDDMYIGEGHKYQKTFMDAVKEGYRDGILEQQPTLVNLQCDVDHPTQCMADLLHIIHHFGGVENLRGKKLAMTRAYSPSYGKPLSVPQGVIGLMTRFGMDVVLAHPEGYDVMPQVEDIARRTPPPAAAATRKSPPWRRPLTARTSSIPSPGRLSPPWRSGRSSTRPATRRGSTPWSSGCWPRTPGTRTGPLRGADEAHQKRQRPVPPLPARRHHRRELPAGRGGRLRFSTGTWCPCTRRPASSPTSSPP